MANEIQALAPTGSNVYAIVIGPTGQAWNGTAFEAIVNADWTTYAVALTEQGTTGVFEANFPSAISAGKYSVVAYLRAGGSAAVGDTALAQGEIAWPIALPLTTANITTAVVAGLGLTPLALDGGTVTLTTTPTTTSFTAVGNLNAPAGGYTVAPMVVFWQTGTNRGMKFAISGHAVSGSNHTFTVAAMPSAPASGDTFVIG